MRKLEEIKAKKYDILIVDHVGSEWLNYCLPKKNTYFAIKTRDTLPFIKKSFFFYSFVKFFFKNKALFGANSNLLATSILCAIITELSPKVVMTFIDNSRIMGRLQTIFPDILVISIQNGARSDVDPCFDLCKAHLNFPCYFGFGGRELEIINSKGANFKQYCSIGSLKMGIFISNFYNPVKRGGNISEICLISQHREAIASSANPLDIQLMLSHRNACKLLFKFSKRNNVNIIISMVNELGDNKYQGELEFFKDIFGCDNVTYSANNRKNMGAYQIGMKSDLSIAFHSTLLHELFGVKKKTLFYGDVNRPLADAMGFRSLFKALPDKCLLNSWDYNEFESKINVLLAMNDNSFSNETADAREFLMNFGDKFPHQIIHDAVQEKCR